MVLSLIHAIKTECFSRKGFDMGAIGGLVGLGGGAAGTSFNGPEEANLIPTTTNQQYQQSYDQNQAALQQQQSLLTALQGQNGLGNQTASYNNLGSLNAQLGNTADANMGLYGQLQNIAAGQGPNPAQAMLNQRTGENVANQAALMAGQRGAGANVGLMARQAAQQGANTQQQAIGQGATMQAQQSLGALGQAGGILGQQAGIQERQAGVLGQQAGLANTMVANQIGGTGAVTGANQAQFGNLVNAINAQNSASVASQGNVNTNNASLANTQMQGQQSLLGGLMNGGGASSMMGGSGGGGGGAGMMAMMAAHGGTVHKMAMGGSAGAQSEFGQFLTGVSAVPISGVAGSNSVSDAGAQALGPQGSSQKQSKSPAQSALQPTSTQTGVDDQATGSTMLAARGGMVPVKLSPQEKIVRPEKVREAVGGRVEAETVPGKAKYPGDNLKNDTFETEVPEGTIIVPRTKAKNERDAADFVRKTLAKRRKR